MRDIRPPRDPRREEAHPRAPQGAAPAQRGTRGLRDVVADANDLGRAAAQAGRAARRSYAEQEGSAPIPPAAPRGGAEVPYKLRLNPPRRRALSAAAGAARRNAPPSRGFPERPVRAFREGRHHSRLRAAARRRRRAVLPEALSFGPRHAETGGAGGGNAEGQRRPPEDHRPRSASPARSRSLRWRSAWCSMTRIRPRRRASSMSAR